MSRRKQGLGAVDPSLRPNGARRAFSYVYHSASGAFVRSRYKSAPWGHVMQISFYIDLPLHEGYEPNLRNLL